MLFDEQFRLLDWIRIQELDRSLPRICLLAAIAATLLSSPASAIAKVRLAPQSRKDHYEQVRVVVEARGHLKLNADGTEIRRLPISIKGDLTYDERRLDDSPESLRAARLYRKTKATIQVGKNKLQPALSEQHRLLVLHQQGEQLNFHSPLGPLSKEELDLVQVQANSVVLDQLLPGKEVELESEWKAPETALGKLLLLDDVSSCDVMCTLRQVEGELAIIHMEGPLTGAVGGVATDIDVKAKLNVDLKRGHVNWLAMTIKENRSIGHAEPGLEVTARVRVAMRDIEPVAELSDEALGSITLNANDTSQVLRFQSAQGRFQVIHDPRWMLMVDRRDVSIFRFVDKGDLVAQCNVSSLTDLPAGKRLKLNEFQRDIQSTLDKNFGQFIEASEFQSEAGLSVLRVAVAGKASELPIHWLYYHLSTPEGRCASLVFTFEATLAERFGGADASFIDGFRITSPEPTPEQLGPSATVPSADEVR